MRPALLATLSLPILLLGVAPARGQGAPAAADGATPPVAVAPAYESDAKFVEAMADARKLRHSGDYSGAIGDFKKAVKISNGQCRRCLNDLYAVQFGMGSFKDAAATAGQLQAIAETPVEKSVAEFRLGDALYRQGGDKPKPAQLDAAHTALQAALADFPRNNAARWADGCVLARMGKLDDAKQEFSACAAGAAPNDPMRLRAEHFAENPTLSLQKMAPAFEVTALDGTRFNLDDMNGKVVLIDFWATWCGPCNAELPHIKKIVREFAGQPLVVISISRDADEARWREFVTKNEMTWVQYRDRDNKLADLFGVKAIPNYFTIDSDGVLTTQIIGSGDESDGIDGRLKKLLKRAQARPAAAPVVAAN